MIPVGITCSYRERINTFCLEASYCRAVEKAGGLPFIMATLQIRGIAAYLSKIKGLLLSGGDDVDPYFFGEEPLPGCGQITPARDILELKLVKEALQRNMPVLAICRGMQVLNIACGGDIYQDLTLRHQPSLQHWQKMPASYPFHSIELIPGNILTKLIGGKKRIRVNSFHHQSVRKVGAGLQVTACSPDGVVEALEMEGKTFVLGVQWHPEALSVSGSEGGQELFDTFVQAAARYKPAS